MEFVFFFVHIHVCIFVFDCGRCSSERVFFFLLRNIRKIDGTFKSVRVIHGIRLIRVRCTEVWLCLHVLCCPLRFDRKFDVRFIYAPICFVWVHVLFMSFVFIFISVHWCPTRSISDDVCVTTGAASGTETTHRSRASESTPGYLQVGFDQSLVVCVEFCRSLFVPLSCSFGHCIVCLSIYGFWLPLWHLQTILCYGNTIWKNGDYS